MIYNILNRAVLRPLNLGVLPCSDILPQWTTLRLRGNHITLQQGNIPFLINRPHRHDTIRFRTGTVIQAFVEALLNSSALAVVFC